MFWYMPGSLSWVDLATPDPERAGAFYRELFDRRVADRGLVGAGGGVIAYFFEDPPAAGANHSKSTALAIA